LACGALALAGRLWSASGEESVVSTNPTLW